MSPKQLHTRQYSSAALRTIGLVATTAAVGAAGWCGAGTAHAAPDYEQQACALMDDHATAIHLGYSSYPSEYAFSVLSKEMPPLDAAHTLRAATRDVCPNHAGDMPRDWQ